MARTDPAHEARRVAFDQAVERLVHNQKANGATAVVNLTEAAKLVGVSRGRLYRAIEAGRLDVMPGGGPGKPTMVTREALQRAGFPVSEALTERSIERSMVQTPAEAERFMERLADQVSERLAGRFTEDLRAVLAPLVEDLIGQSVAQLSMHIERSIERLIVERAVERPERSVERLTPVKTSTPAKAAVLARFRAMLADGLSYREIAARLNAEGVPTLSGQGRWHPGTLANLRQERMS